MTLLSCPDFAFTSKQLGVASALAQDFHFLWRYFFTLFQQHIGHLLIWGVHLSVSYLFAFSYCSWGSPDIPSTFLNIYSKLLARLFLHEFLKNCSPRKGTHSLLYRLHEPLASENFTDGPKIAVSDPEVSWAKPQNPTATQISSR